MKRWQSYIKENEKEMLLIIQDVQIKITIPVLSLWVNMYSILYHLLITTNTHINLYTWTSLYHIELLLFSKVKFIIKLNSTGFSCLKS